jgi:signal transduction histidine kinase
MKFSIRRRLLVVVALGVATCGLSLYAVTRPFAAANRQRREQAQERVMTETQRVASGGDPRASKDGIRSGHVGRGGVVDTFDSLISTAAPDALRDVIAQSEASGSFAVAEVPVADGTLCIGAAPMMGQRYAWAAYVITTSRWSPVLRIVGVMLGLVSVLLVLASLHAIGSIQRGANALRGSLSALSTDLGSPVPRPNVRELSDIADGIASLALDLSRAQAALTERERLAVLGRVTAGLAHELRNPLAAIKLQIDLACREPNAPQAIVDKLSGALDEIGRLDRLVKDLLTVAVRRTGPRQEIEVADLVKKRVELLTPFADDRQVAVDIAGSARAAIEADSIARVIDNLLRNAIEASPIGACVQIEISNARAHMHVRIVDRGSGIHAERRAELFEPFFTTKADGVGLGLALSRAIASAHGGALSYVRENGTTIFELSLPAKGDAS